MAAHDAMVSPMDDAFMDALHEIRGGLADCEVGDVLGRHPRYGLVPESVDDPGDPPALSDPRLRETPDFEAMLGRYDPDRARITYWPRGIAHVSGSLDVEPALLRRIVEWHENAHSLHHVGIAKVSAMPGEVAGILRRQDEAFRLMPEGTAEQVAQLATLVTVRTRLDGARTEAGRRAFARMLDVFLTLMARQSAAYRLPPDVRTGDLPRLRRKLALLLDMTDALAFPTPDHVARILD